MRKEKICWLSLFGGLFFALCTLIGVIYAPAGNTPATMGKWSQIRPYLPVLAGLSAFFYFILRRVFHRDYTLEEKPAGNRLTALFARRPVLFSVVVVLAAWAPYLAACYPGNVAFDGARQFRQALGTEALTNQHPVFGTLLLGALFRIGSVVNDNFGVFTVVAVQTLLTAAAVGVSERRILSLTRSVPFALMSLAYFAIVPIWGMFAQTVVKDTPFTALFLFYAVCYVELAEQLMDKSKDRPFDWKNAACLCAAGVLCCLMRHGEVAVIAVTMLLLVVFALRDRWKTLVLTAVTVAIALGGSRLITRVTGAGSPPTRATFSVFFQQTALYMKRHPKDVKKSEYKVIDAVLDADAIGELYNPLLSDPVKNTYREDVSRRELIRYFRVWYRMFLRHPKTYFDSFLQFSYSYIEPFHCAEEKRVFYTGFLKVEGMDLQYPQASAVKKYLVSFTGFLRQTPVLQQLLFPGTYFWISAVCWLLLWHKGRIRQMAVFSLPFMRVLMCLASPVAGYFRYALPLLAITPLMMAWARANAAPSAGE